MPRGDRIGIGLNEPEVEPRRRALRRPLAPEHPGEAPDPVAHRVDAAARESGRRRRPGPHPGGGLELPREREHLLAPRLDAVAGELPRPDPGPHRGRRAAKLEREHHPPKDRLTHPAGAVHGP